MGRIELPTYSFAYTSSSSHVRRARLYIYLSAFRASRYPCQSFGRLLAHTPRSWPVGLLTVIRDSSTPRGIDGQGFAAHHGVALPLSYIGERGLLETHILMGVSSAPERARCTLTYIGEKTHLAHYSVILTQNLRELKSEQLFHQIKCSRNYIEDQRK
jgi:hypothetical protein